MKYCSDKACGKLIDCGIVIEASWVSDKEACKKNSSFYCVDDKVYLRPNVSDVIYDIEAKGIDEIRVYRHENSFCEGHEDEWAFKVYAKGVVVRPAKTFACREEATHAAIDAAVNFID